MRLVTLHKVMIGASIGMSLLYALWAGWMSQSLDSPRYLAGMALALAVAVALILYLRFFIRKQRRK